MSMGNFTHFLSKYSRVRRMTVPDRSSRPTRLGMAIIPLRVSEMFHMRVPEPTEPTTHIRTKAILKMTLTTLLLLLR